MSRNLETDLERQGQEDAGEEADGAGEAQCGWPLRKALQIADES